MLILSHRGYHATVPENTQDAFEQAFGMGVDGFETDVRLSADGVPILFHDRVAPDGREVASFPHDELSRVVGFEVPTLEAMVSRWQEAFWNVEIKAPEALAATVDVVRRYSGGTRFLISSFWHPVVAECCRVADVDGGLLVAHRPLELTSLLANVRNGGKVKALVWDYETVDEELLRQAASEGAMNCVYGAVTKAEHRRLAALNVDCVITDRPELMINR